MSDTATFRFDIRAIGVPRLRNIVEATNSRAAAHGLSGYQLELSEPFEKPWTDLETGRSLGTVRLVTATLTGAIPRHHGWTILARLDHDDQEAGGSGETVMSLFPGLPEDLTAVASAHRTRTQQCDGCRATRERTSTYLAFHRETNRVMQLGSTCVEPYTGLPLKGLEVLWRFRTLNEGDEENEGDAGGFPQDLRLPVMDVLRVTAAVVTLTGGYRSREMSWAGETTTADMVSAYFFDRRAIELREDVDAEADAAKTAKAVRAWALAGYGMESDYRHKVGVLAKGETIHNRHLAVLASAVAGWSRDQRSAAEEAAARNSRHQGQVGDRITVTATVTRTHELDSRTYGYHEQERWLVTFQDAENNVYVWYANTSKIPDEGETVRLTGTVKKHDTYRDIPQTVVNRCRITTPEPATA